MIILPEEIKFVLETIEKNGYEAYVVGGSIRDILLSKEPKDWDITTSAPVDKVIRFFDKTIELGKQFGIVKVIVNGMAIDVASYRIDSQYSDFRRPDEVVFSDSIEEDLKRRDFTVNAIAYSHKRGFVDVFGGRADLKVKRITCVGNPLERFEEDPLRILRGIRIAAELGFQIQKDTLAAMQEKKYLLDRISVERIREEFNKILMSDSPSRGLEIACEQEILGYVLKDFTQTDYRLAETKIRLDRVKKDLVTRLVLFMMLFDRNKASNAAVHLKYDQYTLKRIAIVQSEYDNVIGAESKVLLKKLINKIGFELFDFIVSIMNEQQRINGVDPETGQRIKKWLEEIERGAEPVTLSDLKIKGSDLIALGIEEGILVGRVLESLLDKVQQDPSLNDKDILIKTAKQLNDEAGAQEWTKKRG